MATNEVGYTPAYTDAKFDAQKSRDSDGYTTNNVETKSSTDAYGNSYTTSVSNDKLSNDDFLKLMLEELKMQDPTKPMDSQRMLDSQMQMSSIETNLSLVKSMETLTNAYSQSALSNASSVIGRNIEDGNINEQGINKAYTVRSVSNEDGQINVVAQEILYLETLVKDADDKIVNYNTIGEIYNEQGEKTGNKFVLDAPGSLVLDDNGKPMVLDENNEPVADSNYALAGQTMPVYSDQLTTVPFSAITRVF